MLAARTASREVAFFLPHLRSGMRVLDVGCGPGSITLGLAEVVAPAEVVGVDLQPAQVEQARALAAERGVTNARFEVASVYELPFPNGSFDAVLAHGVLMGLREPVRALQELRRVLRPGGVVGVRDADMGCRHLHPRDAALGAVVGASPPGPPAQRRRASWAATTASRLLEAGFARAEAQRVGDERRIAGRNAPTRRLFQGSACGHARTAIAEGWLDQSTADAIAEEFDAWAERPDAFSARIYCEALGWVDA